MGLTINMLSFVDGYNPYYKIEDIPAIDDNEKRSKNNAISPMLHFGLKWCLCLYYKFYEMVYRLASGTLFKENCLCVDGGLKVESGT